MRVVINMMLVGLVAAALPAANVAAQTALSQDSQELASRLVDLTFPSESIRQDAKRSYATNFRASFLRNPRAQSANERMPVLLDTIVDAGGVELDQVLANLFPSLKTVIAGSYAKGMSSSDLAHAVAFYSGPVGRKLVDATPRMATGGDIRQVLNASELSQFAAFSRSTAGQKVEALKSQQANQIGSAVNEALSAAAPRIEAAAMTAGQKYMQAQQATK